MGFALVKAKPKDDFLAALDAWLATHRSTLWGRSFDIMDPKTRRLAAEWLLDVLLDLREDHVIPAEFFKRARRNGQ